MALTKVRDRMTEGAMVNVLDFGAIGDGVNDDTAAIQNAITQGVATGGTIYFPLGKYKLTSTLNVPTGAILLGASRGRESDVASTLYAVHTGPAVLSYKGSVHCKTSNINIETDATTYPKTGILLGRSSSASAGHHYFEFIRIQGHFSEAVIYSIASEVNTYNDLYVWLLGGGAKHVLYTSVSDNLSVDSLVTSTNVNSTFISAYLISSVNDANASVIYLGSAEEMGSWNFFSAYLIANSGAYVWVDCTNGAARALGPYNFIGCSFERMSGGDPIYGYRVTASVNPHVINGLNIIGSRFDLLAGASHYTFFMNNVTLNTPNIVLQQPEAFVYASNVYYRDRINGGIFKVGREYDWVNVVLAGAWLNSYGSPLYRAASYMIDGEGIVHLAGTVTSGSGTIFTLPANFRPDQNLIISTGSSSILITASTGVVSLFSGSAPVNLSGISFKAGA